MQEGEPECWHLSSADIEPRTIGRRRNDWWAGCREWLETQGSAASGNRGQGNQVLDQAEGETRLWLIQLTGIGGPAEPRGQESWPPRLKQAWDAPPNNSGSPLPSQTGLPNASGPYTEGGQKKGESCSQWNIVTSFLTRDTGYHLKKSLNYWVWMNLNTIGHSLSLRLYVLSQPS